MWRNLASHHNKPDFSQAPGGVGEKDIFPHLYNDLRLGKDEVESVVEWERQSDWDIAIEKAKADAWFLY